MKKPPAPFIRSELVVAKHLSDARATASTPTRSLLDGAASGVVLAPALCAPFGAHSNASIACTSCVKQLLGVVEALAGRGGHAQPTERTMIRIHTQKKVPSGVSKVNPSRLRWWPAVVCSCVGSASLWCANVGERI